MTSRWLQALDFIKRYFARWGYSPTLSELAAGLDVSIKRAHEIVHRLAEEGMIEVVAGKARGMRLLDRAQEISDADVLLRLSAMGWKIYDGNVIMSPPIAAAFPLTDKGLHSLPVLDHNRAGTTGAGKRGKKVERR
jgi:SOS-response transcriptional repressor LexA